MGICDVCMSHSSRRNFVEGNKYLSLVNLTASQLKSMTLDELNNVYSIAKTGAMVCSDCKKLCSLGDSDCTSQHLKNQKAYSFRIDEDRRAMKQIISELDRRINIKQAYDDLQKYST